MTDQRWEQARELFLDLADRPEGQRRDELARLERTDLELAAQIRGLLHHDLGPSAPVADERPTRFGPYEAIRLIGAGGMGEVFVARRADGEYDREVAVKLLRRGTANEEWVRRFLRERQTLARLDHEYIAGLLDGGTTETGEPYLVMEYVDGEPADVFAKRLELRGRLELFVRIGRAVEHAHERGFVHRDLKPSNILVRPDGTPRLLDFGIARPDTEAQVGATGDEPLTRTGHRLFTPQYASPEQVLGRTATQQSDIFSLGVVLYEFLCGASPWPDGDSQVALEFGICEREPFPPSRRVTGTARGRISGDLDAIVLQCLAKRPDRRYASVAELCDDIERHLAGHPIRARRTGALGRAVRFTRRRPFVPVVITLLLVALVATLLAWDAERRGERRRGELAAAISDRIASARARWAGGNQEGAHQELDAAMLAVLELPGRGQLEAEVLVQKAVFANLQSEWSTALAHLDRARPLLAEPDGKDVPDPHVYAAMLNSYAYAYQETEPGERSLEAARVALEFARANLAPDDLYLADALVGWAEELRRDGKGEEALEALEEAVAATRRNDPKSEELSRFLNEVAIAHSRAGRYEEATAEYEEALEILAWQRGERHSSFPKVRINLGTTFFRQGRFEEAKEQYELSLEGSISSGLELHAAVNRTYLARIHSREGDQEAAEAAAIEALDTCERLGVESHADRARCVLGMVQARTARLAEARTTLAAVLLEEKTKNLGPELEADARHALGALLQDEGEEDVALPHLERALELKLEQLGPAHEDCVDLAARLGREG